MAINRNSVPRFPRDRIRDITSERFDLEKTSATIVAFRTGWEEVRRVTP